MATESQEELERRLKELEREKREEEVRQLKANGRIRWITPTALAALLPLMGAFCLWGIGEIKQYNEGYKALKEKEKLEQEKEALRRQKDSLNVEIATLLQLKEHYAAQAKELRQDVQAKQEIMDKVYLRGVFASTATVDALDHIKSQGPGPDEKALSALRADIKQLPKESAARMENVLDRYKLMVIIVDISWNLTLTFQKAVDFLPASDWARRLRPTRSGEISTTRRLMVSESGAVVRYYDVDEGRFLSPEEAKKDK